MCIPLDYAVTVIGCFVVFDLGLACKNMYEYLTSNEIAEKDRTIFVIFYAITHAVYPYCVVILFIFDTKCMPDSVTSRLRVRRCCLLIMTSCLYTIILLTVSYFIEGWIISMYAYFMKMGGQLLFALIYLYLMGILNKFLKKEQYRLKKEELTAITETVGNEDDDS